MAGCLSPDLQTCPLSQHLQSMDSGPLTVGQFSGLAAVAGKIQATPPPVYKKECILGDSRKIKAWRQEETEMSTQGAQRGPG